jgi:ATP-dependent DNA helicase MPH1
MQELEKQKAIGFALHPKMEELLNILIQHFGQSDEGEETRVMVFSSYRAVVDRIVEELRKHEPLLRATRFIGQGTDKQGKKGLAQREQQEVWSQFLARIMLITEGTIKVIQKFQSGTYNILVATSIGEEGLDIGEIDVTVCYDADKAPIRMVSLTIK